MNGDFESYVVEDIRCDDRDIEWVCDIEQNCQGDIDIVILNGTWLRSWTWRMRLKHGYCERCMTINYICTIARW